MGTVSLVGAAPQHYYVASEDCSSRNLAHSASCTVSVRFRPTEAGNHRATLQVEADFGQTRLAYMLGSARSVSKSPPLGSGNPAECLKAKKNVSLARKKVRQTRQKLRQATTKAGRQAIRKRLVRRQQDVRRAKALVAKRCS